MGCLPRLILVGLVGFLSVATGHAASGTEEDLVATAFLELSYSAQPRDLVHARQIASLASTSALQLAAGSSSLQNKGLSLASKKIQMGDTPKKLDILPERALLRVVKDKSRMISTESKGLVPPSNSDHVQKQLEQTPKLLTLAEKAAKHTQTERERATPNSLGKAKEIRAVPLGSSLGADKAPNKMPNKVIYMAQLPPSALAPPSTAALQTHNDGQKTVLDKATNKVIKMAQLPPSALAPPSKTALETHNDGQKTVLAPTKATASVMPSGGKPPTIMSFKSLGTETKSPTATSSQALESHKNKHNSVLPLESQLATRYISRRTTENGRLSPSNTIDHARYSYKKASSEEQEAPMQSEEINTVVSTQEGIHEYVSLHAGELLDMPGLVWMGPILTHAGYGTEARSYALDLAEVVDVAVAQFGDRASQTSVLKQMDARQAKKIESMMQKDLRIDGAVVLCHSTAPRFFGGDFDETWDGPCPLEHAGATVGRSMFETDSLPEGWTEKLNRMDEVWVPSKFNVKSFQAAGVDPHKLHVIPESIDTEVVFNPDNVKRPWPLLVPPHDSGWQAPKVELLKVIKSAMRSEPGGEQVDGELAAAAADAAATAADAVIVPSPLPLPPLDAMFKFLSMSKWEYRKGFDLLLRAYCEEFKFDENVVLYIKTNAFVRDPHGEMDNIRDRISSVLKTTRDNLPRMAIIDEWLEEADLPSLYTAVDAFVLPSRGEGWGRPQAEAMSMGLPVITTDWGGTSEFINDNVALPVEVETLQKLPPTAQIEMLGAEGILDSHHFALPSVKSLRAQMRWAFEHKEEGAALGKRAREHMRRHFSRQAVTKIVEARLAELKILIKSRHYPETWLREALQKGKAAEQLPKELRDKAIDAKKNSNSISEKLAVMKAHTKSSAHEHR